MDDKTYKTPPTTPEEKEEALLASFWNVKFKDAMIAKAPFVRRWVEYMDAYSGDYFKNKTLPDYKSNLVSNYIYSIVETIRPIMVDNDPRFQAVPRQPEGVSFSEDLQEILSYEWDREGVSLKLYRELINTLVLGTSVFFIPWNPHDKNINAIPVSPFNVFPDPLATTVENAEYIIYASYKNVQIMRKAFPKKASRIEGGNVRYPELVYDNNKNAKIDNQVLVLEIYTRDYENFDVVKGEIKTTRMKYPNGRQLVVCPDLGLVLSDKAMPYRDKEFPFVLIKDFDLPGKFWGEGEVQQLISPQKYMNELNNAVIDNAKASANMPWIVDKNAGIPKGSLTSRPGLVIRKNPGTEIKRDQPPSLPIYVNNAIEILKGDMEQISGIFDSLRGKSESGVYTAQGLLALQEAGQARVRLKVKIMEDALGVMANMWFSRMKQFWKDDRFIQISRQDGTYDVRTFSKNILKYDYDVKITAGSTMPVNRGAMLDLMTRLAQTPMPDGSMLVDREAVATYLPEEVKAPMLRRMRENNQVIEQLTQQVQELTEQLQQIAEQGQQNDEQTFGVIEDITSAIEQINKKILQVKQSYDTMNAEKAKQDEITRIKDSSYNAGYADAERILANTSGEALREEMELPDDVLAGLESLSDDELALLVEQNPDLLELIG